MNPGTSYNEPNFSGISILGTGTAFETDVWFGLQHSRQVQHTKAL